MICILRKKGFALATAIYFVIIAAITSVGIYMYSSYMARETTIDKTNSTRGYYCALAGLRYAYILLKNPVTNFSFDAAMNGESKTINITNSNPLYNDLGLGASDSLSITVTEYNSDSPGDPKDPQYIPPNNYRVTATFSS